MENKIKVTIVIPAYNVENYIERGLVSCINQTYSNVEIIVVDDGSIDSTALCVESQSKFDDRIILIQQDNKGVSSARNNALRHATGDYVLFLDSDDWLETNAVEVLVNSQLSNKDGFIVCSRYIVDGKDMAIRVNDDHRKKADVITDDKILESFLVKYFYFHSSCYKLFDLRIIRKNQIWFSEKISHGEDGLFVFSYLQHVLKVVSLPIPLWNVLDRENSASNSAFNEKKLTAIYAVEQMLTFSISEEVRHELVRYLVIRAETLYLDAYIDGVGKNISVLRMIKKKLKKYKEVVSFSQTTCREKVRYILLTYMPVIFLKIVLKIKGMI